MLSLVKKSSIKQFVVYCLGCKEKWEYGGGLKKFRLLLLSVCVCVGGGGFFERGA